MKFLIALSLLLASAVIAVAQTATGTFVASVPVTTTTTINGTVSCNLSVTGTVLTCTFSQAIPANAAVTLTLPSGL